MAAQVEQKQFDVNIGLGEGQDLGVDLSALGLG